MTTNQEDAMTHPDSDVGYAKDTAVEAHKSQVYRATEYQYAGFPDEPGIASAHGPVPPFAEQWDGGREFYDSMASPPPVGADKTTKKI